MREVGATHLLPNPMVSGIDTAVDRKDTNKDGVYQSVQLSLLDQEKHGIESIKIESS